MRSYNQWFENSQDTGRKLTAAVIADPEDASLRMILADALEEVGGDQEVISILRQATVDGTPFRVSIVRIYRTWVGPEGNQWASDPQGEAWRHHREPFTWEDTIQTMRHFEGFTGDWFFNNWEEYENDEDRLYEETMHIDKMNGRGIPGEIMEMLMESTGQHFHG